MERYVLLTDFYGCDVGCGRDLESIPPGVGGVYEERNLGNILPANVPIGTEVISFTARAVKVDPVVLRNQWHQILYQWPDDYTPSWVDVLQVCKGLGLA